MRAVLFLGIFLLLSLGAYAVEISLNSTLNITNIDKPSSVFADGGYIYIIGDTSNQVSKFYIDDGKLRLKRKIGETDSASDGYMRYSEDIWVDGNYIYVLDSSNEFFKFEKDGTFKFKGDRDSYKPEDGVGIAALNSTIYMVDKKNERINIVYEYDDNKYISNGSISLQYLGIGDAVFISPSDVYVYGDYIYIVDSGKDRIAVFDTALNYINSYGRGRGGTRFSTPYYIAVDEDYIYVVQSDLESITAIEKEGGAVAVVINSTQHDFGRIGGIFEYNDTLYVTDNRDDQLAIFTINRTASLDYNDVKPLHDNFNSSTVLACSLYSVSDELGISVQNKCGTYTEQLNNATAFIDGGDYDAAYSLMKSSTPSLEGAISYVKPKVSGRLNAMLNEQQARLSALALNLSGELNMTYNKIEADLSKADESISSQSYESALAKLKEIQLRIDALNASLGRQEGTKESLKENYSSQLESLKERYAEISIDAAVYPADVNTTEIEQIIADVNDSIGREDFDAAYDGIAQLSMKVYSAEKKVEDVKKKVSEANSTIAAAQQRVEALRNSTLFILSPNTKPIEDLIANATAELSLNPSLSKSLAEQAINDAAAESKNFEDTKFLIFIGIAASALLLVFFGLIALGIYFLLRMLRKR